MCNYEITGSNGNVFLGGALDRRFLYSKFHIYTIFKNNEHILRNIFEVLLKTTKKIFIRQGTLRHTQKHEGR